MILAAGDHRYLMPAVQSDLDDDMRRTAEADQQQPTLLRYRSPLERAVTDQATAQQWRDVFVIETFGQLVSEVLRDDGIFRVSAIVTPSPVSSTRPTI